MPENAGSYIGISIAKRDGDKGIWADSYFTGFADVDARTYANREDRNMVWSGGGKIAWNGSAISFSANIDFINHVTAFKHTLTTAASPITLNATGKFAYFTIGRKPTVDGTTTSAIAEVQGALPNASTDNSNYVLAYRTADSTVILPMLKKELLSGDYYGLNGSLTFFEYMATAFKPIIQTGSTANKIKIAGSASIPACVIIDGKMYASTSDVEADITVVGSGGIDTGAIAANTLYYVFAIPGSGRAVALTFSTSPTSPSGFSSYTRIGTFTTTPSATIAITNLNNQSADVIVWQEQASPSNPSSGSQKMYVNSTTKKLTMRKSDGSESSVGSGSGSINYITNGDAESGVSGWAAYADAAASSPVDGTGGSPVTTITATSTTPLVGTNSLLLTKDAANRQGEGVSYDFTIDRAYQAKVLRGILNYQIASGTFADNDLSIWIYDKTNSVLIPCSPYQVKNVSGYEQLAFEFQTSSNSTDYRLIIHVSSTSASAYTMKFEVSVGPSERLYGSVITDWRDTPVTGSHTGVNVTYAAKSRRVGDTEEYIVTIAYAGAPTGTGLTVNLTSGRVIDTAKLPTSTDQPVLGIAEVVDSSSTFYLGNVLYSSTTAVEVDLPRISTHTGTVFPNVTNVSATTPMTFGSGDRVTIRFAVPIVGWGTTQLLSQDTTNRVVAFNTYRATSAQTGVNPNNSNAQIVQNTIRNDTHGGYNTSTGQYTVQVPGYYEFIAGIWISGTNVLASNYNATIFINGSAIIAGTQLAPAAGASFLRAVSTPPIFCNAGDVIALYLYGAGNNSASTLTTGTDPVTNYFGGKMVQGPSQIAASESIACRYKQETLNQSIPSTPTRVIWNIKSFDTHGGMNTSTGTYTCQANGKYAVSCTVRYQATSMTISDQTILYLYKNGAQYSKLLQREIEATQSVIIGLSGSDDVDCKAGDTLEIYASNTTSAQLSDATEGECHVSIKRTGL